MTIQINQDVVVDRPVQPVFEFVTTPANDWEWKEDLIETHPPDGDMEAGATWTQEVEDLFGTTVIGFECLELEPPSRFEYRMTSGFAGDRIRATQAEYTFTQAGAGTRLSFSGTVRVNGVLRVLQPLLKRMLGKQIGDSFLELKSVLETANE